MISSLDVLEAFYGDELSPQLVQRLAGTPTDQLLVLASKIVQAHRAVERALARDEVGLGGPPALHDDTYFKAGLKFALADSTDLRYLVLHHEKVIIPDPLTNWAEELVRAEYIDETTLEESPWAAVAAASARQLLPLRPLIKAGHILLLGPINNTAPPGLMMSRIPLGYLMEPNLDRPLGWSWHSDPLLAWLTVQTSNIPDWLLKSRDLGKISQSQEAADYLISNLDKFGRFEHYDIDAMVKVDENVLKLAYTKLNLDPSQLEQASRFAILCQFYGVLPVVANLATQAHLEAGTQVLLGQSPQPRLAPGSAASDAVRFRFPSVSQVAFEDVIRLRLQEDIYHELRLALANTANQVETISHPGDFNSYQNIVREVAKDTVAPVQAKFEKAFRRERFNMAVRGLLVGGFVKLAFAGAATLTSGVGATATRGLSGVTAQAATKASTGKSANRVAARRLALSLCVSLTGDDE